MNNKRSNKHEPAYYVYDYNESSERRSFFMWLSVFGVLVLVFVAWTFNIRGLIMPPQTDVPEVSADQLFSEFTDNMSEMRQNIGSVPDLRQALIPATSTEILNAQDSDVPATSSEEFEGAGAGGLESKSDNDILSGDR